MLDSPPRRGPSPDALVEPDPDPGATVPIVRPTAAAEPAPAPRTWLRRAAGVALTVLTVLQLLGALGYLLVITTIPQDVDLQAGVRPTLVGPPPVADPTAENPGPPVVVPAARATDLHIAKLGLREALIEIDVDAAGVLQPPTSPDLAGWFPGAAAPGDVGPTVIVGHVDSKDGPGVFFKLKDLAAGDLVDVGRSDGRTARYRITDVVTVDKNQFPTQQVYGPTAAPVLRLITCGGAFDAATGHYENNVVVSGALVDPI